MTKQLRYILTLVILKHHIGISFFIKSTYCRRNSLCPNKDDSQKGSLILFQILVVLDTISDWPWWVSWQHFYSQGLPTKKLQATLPSAFLVIMPHLYSFTILLFHWPSKEQVHEERVESSDLCLWLKSAASSFNPLDITANATRPILFTI